MESEWNLITTEKEKESIKRYLETETYYMPSNDFYSHPHNLTIRNLAVSVIAKHWRGVEIDVFVPYLAMNYFDTFVSQSEENPYSEIDQVPLVAIACLTIAAKIREFSDDFDLKDFDPDTIREVELRIHNKLDGLTKPVTPFCFLDHFYPAFERIGGFKRRCINEIIVQAKGENDFIEYKPSDIAFHSFVAATYVAKLTAGLSTIKPPDGVNLCNDIHEKLFRLCRKKGIKIEPPGPNAASSSLFSTSTNAASSSLFSTSTQGKSEQVRAAKTERKTKSVQHRTGKGKGKGKAMEILATIAEDKEEYASDDPLRYCPKKLMNFMLMWPTDDPLSVKEPVEESPRANDEPVANVVCFVCEDSPSCSCSIG